MNTIWKYPFQLADKFSLTMPINAEIVHVEYQPGVGPCMWARVDTLLPMVPKWFHVTGTGQEKPPMSWHLATFQQPPYVWHLWGALESSDELDRKAWIETLPRNRKPVVEAI